MNSRTNILLAALASVVALGLAIMLLPSGPRESLREQELGAESEGSERAAAKPEDGEGSAPEVTARREDSQRTEAESATDSVDDRPRFRVQVLDALGTASAHARVRARNAGTMHPWSRLIAQQDPQFFRPTDEKGFVELEIPEGDSPVILVYATAPEGIGKLEVARSAALAGEAVILQLDTARSMTVKLLDSSGQPVVDQEVHWWRNADPHRSPLARSKSNAQGWARFDGLEQVLEGGSVLGTRFGVPGVFVDPPVREVDQINLSRGQIDLQVPLTGALRVHVHYADDAELPSRLETVLCYQANGDSVHGEFFRWRNATGLVSGVREGWAEFPVVEIGHHWQFAVLKNFLAAPMVAEFAGPMASGERVEHEFVLKPDPLSSHEMRILLPDGSPMASARLDLRVQVSFENGGSSSGSTASTDEDGWTRFDVPYREGAKTWTLKLESSGERSGLHWSGDGEYSPTAHNMPPEVTLIELPLIVSGEVVFTDGTPVKERVDFALATRNSHSDELISHHDFRNLATEPGRFELRSAELDASALVLSARVGDGTAWTDLDIARGQEDVRLVVPELGWVQIDAGENDPALAREVYLIVALPTFDLHTPVERSPFSSESVPRGEMIARQYFDFRAGERLSDVESARSGPMQFAVVDEFGRVLVRRDFDLPPSSTREKPHVISLPPLSLQRYQLTVHTSEGKSPDYCSAAYAGPADEIRWATVRNGVSEFVSHMLPPSMKIKARDHQEQTLNWSTSQHTVVLQAEQQD